MRDDHFQQIADAIRAKTSSSEKIKASAFAEHISKITPLENFLAHFHVIVPEGTTVTLTGNLGYTEQKVATETYVDFYVNTPDDYLIIGMKDGVQYGPAEFPAVGQYAISYTIDLQEIVYVGKVGKPSALGSYATSYLWYCVMQTAGDNLCVLAGGVNCYYNAGYKTNVVANVDGYDKLLSQRALSALSSKVWMHTGASFADAAYFAGGNTTISSDSYPVTTSITGAVTKYNNSGVKKTLSSLAVARMLVLAASNSLGVLFTGGYKVNGSYFVEAKETDWFDTSDVRHTGSELSRGTTGGIYGVTAFAATIKENILILFSGRTEGDMFNELMIKQTVTLSQVPSVTDASQKRVAQLPDGAMLLGSDMAVKIDENLTCVVWETPINGNLAGVTALQKLAFAAVDLSAVFWDEYGTVHTITPSADTYCGGQSVAPLGDYILTGAAMESTTSHTPGEVHAYKIQQVS